MGRLLRRDSLGTARRTRPVVRRVESPPRRRRPHRGRNGAASPDAARRSRLVADRPVGGDEREHRLRRDVRWRRRTRHRLRGGPRQRPAAADPAARLVALWRAGDRAYDRGACRRVRGAPRRRLARRWWVGRLALDTCRSRHHCRDLVVSPSRRDRSGPSGGLALPHRRRRSRRRRGCRRRQAAHRLDPQVRGGTRLSRLRGHGARVLGLVHRDASLPARPPCRVDLPHAGVRCRLRCPPDK